MERVETKGQKSSGGNIMKTFMASPSTIERKWYVVDAEGKTLGRLASEIAKVLRGKHKPIFTPNVDTGDFVIIINAGQAVLTGNKINQKVMYKHSGYPGGLKETPYSRLMAEKPERTLEAAVRGMLPKNRLGRKMIKKLKVFAGAEHIHQAQKPEVWNF